MVPPFFRTSTICASLVIRRVSTEGYELTTAIITSGSS